jgi:hypothetical protein
LAGHQGDVGEVMTDCLSLMLFPVLVVGCGLAVGHLTVSPSPGGVSGNMAPVRRQDQLATWLLPYTACVVSPHL